ncbi:MAG: O-antigen ligase family protein [Phycisphaerales bacterium]|nr:MAG: O-antigen ligase family protein [Phycisphaerales bacterium]
MIERLLMVLLVFMPLAFGVVEAWSEEIVIALAGAISVCFLLKAILARQSQVTWTWAYVPVAVFALVVVVQLIPLPAAGVRILSPNTAARKVELLGDLANGAEGLSSMTISFYRHATRHDLRLVLAVIAVFAVVLNVYRRPDQITRLLATIAAVGGGVALLALAQNAFGNDKIYWFVVSPHGEAHSGPFVNHSHYAQFMNLSVAAALALIGVRVHESFSGRAVTPETVAAYLSLPEAKVVWVLVAMSIVGVGTVFLALSRGGVISMLVAGVFALLVLSCRKPLKGIGWIMAVLALGAFICVLYIGFDAVYDRLSTLSDMSEAEGGRWQILADIAVAWTKFPVLGTGLGTHEVVYPEFDRSVSPRLASHAENEYAQAVEETGALGFAALLAFGVLIGIHYVRAVRNDRLTICTAAYGLGFGLMAILIHSLSDFGQHLPANAVLTAIFCALLIRVSRLGAAADGEPEEAVPVSSRALKGWAAALVAVCLVWAWGLLHADGARRAARHWREVTAAESRLIENNWEGSDAEYVYLLGHATKAADCQPGNIEYQHWLNIYRWECIDRAVDPNTAGMPPEFVEIAKDIVAELSAARRLCPTFGATWCVLGQLERTILGQEEQGIRHIMEGVKLAPCDATTRFVAGMLAVEQGQLDVAREHLMIAVQLDVDDRQFDGVARQLISQFGLPELALQIAGDDARRLYMMAKVLEETGTRTVSADQVRREVAEKLEHTCQEQNASAWVFASLAAMYEQLGELAKAIDNYREALNRDFGQIGWRYRLANLLADTGKDEEAVKEAEIILRSHPEHRAAKNLIDRLAARLRIGN